MSDDLREQAQLTQRDAPASRFDLGTPRLFVAHVVGDPTERGYATRATRFATWADVEALGPTLPDWPGHTQDHDTISGGTKGV